jgi:hypothetical protein
MIPAPLHVYISTASKWLFSFPNSKNCLNINEVVFLRRPQGWTMKDLGGFGMNIKYECMSTLLASLHQFLLRQKIVCRNDIHGKTSERLRIFGRII